MIVSNEISCPSNVCLKTGPNASKSLFPHIYSNVDAAAVRTSINVGFWLGWLVGGLVFSFSYLFEKENGHRLHGAGGANVWTQPFSDARQLPKKSHQTLALLLAPGGVLVVVLRKKINENNKYILLKKMEQNIGGDCNEMTTFTVVLYRFHARVEYK